MLVSTYRYCIKNISFCSLKYKSLKNGDCSLTYPILKEKQKQTDVVSMSCVIYSTIQIKQVELIDHPKSTCRRMVHSPGGGLDKSTDRDQQSWVFLNDPKNTLPLKQKTQKNTFRKTKPLKIPSKTLFILQKSSMI